MKSKTIIVVTLLLILFIPFGSGLAQETTSPVVKAIFFFSPSCGHCQTVINDLLIPMVEEHGEQLQIAAVDVTQANGRNLFIEVLDYLAIPQDEAGVPVMLIGEAVLRGSAEIPAQFPGLVLSGFENGGIDWPAMPPIQASLPDEEQTSEEPGAASPTLTEPDNLEDAVTAAPPDPVGISLAAVILVGMVGSLGYSFLKIGSSEPIRVQTASSQGSSSGYAKSPLYSIGVPLLSLLGLGVSGYLAFIEATQAEAVCGPVGECNLVQASEYARILGIPVAFLGLLFYLTILVAFLAIRFGTLRPSRKVITGLIGITLLGTLFSIYLTVVEIFLIKAICLWCLSSAVLTTGLLIVYASQNRKIMELD